MKLLQFSVYRLPFTMHGPFTVYRSLFTVRYPFTVIHGQWLTLWNASTLAGYADSTGLIVNGKCTVNSKRLMVNEASEGGVS